MFYPTNSFGNSETSRGSGASRPDAEVDELRADIERLLLITEGLWNILKEKHAFDDEELFKRIVEIDMRDGKLDSKLAATPPRPCPKCNRTLFKHRPRCPYCGEHVVLDPFER